VLVKKEMLIVLNLGEHHEKAFNPRFGAFPNYASHWTPTGS
jgi:hypothetical protein